MNDYGLLILILTIVLVPIFGIIYYGNNWINDQKKQVEQEKTSIININCTDLKSHIINDDMKHWSQSYLETQYKWRCIS